MQRDRVPDRNVLADKDAILLFHAMQNAAVLDIRVRADANRMHISAQDCVHPYARMFAEHHVADDLS